MSDNPAAIPASDRHVPHVLPPRTLLATAAALFALTAVTVATSRLELGALNVVVALAIACAKAAAVALFFMHLKYANRFQLVILVAAALFAALLVSFVVFDTTRYQPDIRAGLNTHGRSEAHDAVAEPGARGASSAGVPVGTSSSAATSPPGVGRQRAPQ